MKTSIVASVILAACAAFTTYAGGVISVNIADGSSGLVPSDTTEYGLAPAAGNTWINVTQTEPNPFEVDLGSGAKATFASTGSFGRYKPDGVTVDASAPFLKRYIDDGSGQITVDVSGIPYRAYKVIVYMQTDWAGSTGGWSVDGPDYHPVLVNDAWYTYDTNKGDTVVGTQDAYWGKYGEGAAVEGVNALVVEKQVGSDLTIAIPKRWPRRSCLCAFQIVEDDSVVFAPSAISVNFHGVDYPVSGRASVSGLATGYLPASSWNNMDCASGTDVALSNVWNGTSLESEVGTYPGLVVSWFGGNVYHYSTGVVDSFLKGFLTDSDANPPSVTVSGIPFEEYDLIVYMAADWNWHHYHEDCTNLDFQAVRVNGKAYTWNAEAGLTVPGEAAWGQMMQPTAALGVNALRIKGLSGSTLEFHTHSQNENGRGNIAAFQIVKPMPADYVATGDVTTKEINGLAESGKEFSVEIPAGKKLILGKKPLVCSKLTVICKGDLVLDTDHEPNEADESTLAKIDLSAVRGLVFHGWQPTARVISFNFNGDETRLMSTLDGFAGAFAGEEIPASSWNDISATPKSGTISPVVWNGSKFTSEQIAGLTLSWTNGDCWQDGTSPDVFRRGWFSDWSLTIEGLPADLGKYDIIFYFNWDGKDEHFRSILVNGSYYVGDGNGLAVQTTNDDELWGTTNKDDGSRRCSESATMGINAFRLNDQEGKTISISQGKTAWLRYLAAVQIVEHVKPRRYTQPLIITVR